MELKTTNHKDLFAFFHHLVYIGCDPEVKHGKPSPDGFLIAAQRFPDNPDPKKVLVFEDAPNGVEAARAAGMQCVWVPSIPLDVNKHSDKATQILTSLEEFKPEDFGLPPYNNS
ncbi:hypothetical protein KUTeg_012097 [Tegillarca granosa]|uniref:Uncharacterized protein n=1 Tax=Tegillarca granosa TaxID=220873 RepID=A0ABQ9F1S5_TEGGR|nr:hypothetical protein KUTeg_012097 [Tegillarca granosa]